MRRVALIVAHAVLAALAAPRALGADGPQAVAVFPVQNRAGDSEAAAAVDEAVRLELGPHGSLVGLEETRDALRRLRIRNGDRAAPLLLRQLGQELRADWLVSATLHDADRYLAPCLTLSVRIYSGATGELLWTGFRGESGLDRRKLLGLGTIPQIERLAGVVAHDLLGDLPPKAASEAHTRGRRDSAERASRLGTVAVVPFTGSTEWLPTRSAEAVTEAAQARLFADGVRLLSPNRLHEVLRRLQGGRWGGATAETRAALGAAGADAILTGTVEAYELGGSEAEPEPTVAVAMRLLDVPTGRILWTGSQERSGWDAEGLFRRGRVYSRGALTARVVQALARRLDDARLPPRPEGRR